MTTIASLRRSERAIQTDFITSLDKIAEPSVVRFAVPNERPLGTRNGKLTGAAMAHLRDLRLSGAVFGFPDIVVLWPVAGGWQVCLLEFKAKGGQVSDNQRAAHEYLRRAGLDVTVVRSVDEAIAACTSRGMPWRLRGA